MHMSIELEKALINPPIDPINVLLNAAVSAFSVNSSTSSVTSDLWHVLRKTAHHLNGASDHIFPVLLDTGCLVACSGFVEDFNGKLACGHFCKIKTADGVTEIAGFRILQWSVTDLDGEVHIIHVSGHCAPTVEMHLLSPQD